MEQLAINLKHFRLMHGYSVERLAKELRCSNSTITNWEKEIGCPNASKIQMLCDIYKIEPGQLMGGSPCKELDSFYTEYKDILSEIASLEKQKSEIDTKLRKYHEIFYKKRTT